MENGESRGDTVPLRRPRPPRSGSRSGSSTAVAAGVTALAVVGVVAAAAVALRGSSEGDVVFGAPTAPAPATSSTRPAATASTAGTVDGDAVRADAPRVDVAADGLVTFSAAVEVPGTARFRALQLAVRGRGGAKDDSAGQTLDLAFRAEGTTVAGRTSVDGERVYEPGTYVVYVAWMLADGVWHNGPKAGFTVG